jgi:hypothetical protein
MQKYIQQDKKAFGKTVKHGKTYYKKIPEYIQKVSLEDLATFDTYAFKREKLEINNINTGQKIVSRNKKIDLT